MTSSSKHPDGKVLIIGGGIANFTNVAATFKVRVLCLAVLYACNIYCILYAVVYIVYCSVYCILYCVLFTVVSTVCCNMYCIL